MVPGSVKWKWEPSHHWFCLQQVEWHRSALCFTGVWLTAWPTNVRQTTPWWWPGWDAKSHLHYWDLPSGLCGDPAAPLLLWLQWISHWWPVRASSTDWPDWPHPLYFKSNFMYILQIACRFSFTCLYSESNHFYLVNEKIVVLTGLILIATALHSANAPQAKQCCVHLHPFLAVITSPRCGIRETWKADTFILGWQEFFVLETFEDVVDIRPSYI